MGEPRFRLDWRLTVDHDEPGRLAAALGPETDDHATLDASGSQLSVEAAGSAGTTLHTLDDVLACLTGALGADEVD